jgi:hypothetical protein
MIIVLQDGLLEPSPEDPPAFALRDNLTLRLKTVSWADFSNVAEARAPDIAPQLTAEGKQFDLVDVGEIALEATLLISGALVQRMGTEIPKLVPSQVWYDAHFEPTFADLGIWWPLSVAGPAEVEKPDAPHEDAEVCDHVTALRAAHPEMTQEALWVECRRRWPGLTVRRWREILQQLPPFKRGRPPGK